MPTHLPVLPVETLALLFPERGGLFVDATVGLGGHSELLLQANPKIKLVALDQDREALLLARQRLGEGVEYHQTNFFQLDKILKNRQADGILMDLGVSSMQLDTPERGFSFAEDGPLDMRMDPGSHPTAAHIVNTWPEPKLADILYQFGEERLSRRIARQIVERRQRQPFTSTKELADLIAQAYPPPARYKRPHPATRSFQALRIVVNQELTVLEQGIAAALAQLAPGGVLAVISFHSLEDRIVKLAFRQAVADGGYELLTKKPVVPGEEEERENPRSRSAKLRGIRRTIVG